MRLFAGVWPSDEVRDALAALPRTEGVRYTRRSQWHVTLRFYGEVDDGDLASVVAALKAAAGVSAPRTVVLGPATRMLGRRLLMIPAAGLDDLAARLGVDEFTGHLTIARDAPRRLAGEPFSARFAVSEIALIRSYLGEGPARYETIATAALSG